MIVLEKISKDAESISRNLIPCIFAVFTIYSIVQNPFTVMSYWSRLYVCLAYPIPKHVRHTRIYVGQYSWSEYMRKHGKKHQRTPFVRSNTNIEERLMTTNTINVGTRLVAHIQGPQVERARTEHLNICLRLHGYIIKSTVVASRLSSS